LARILGCDALDIIWTSGATEASNLVLHHFAATGDGTREVWVSSIEHPCVLETAKHYFPKQLSLIPVDRSGVVDLDWMRTQLTRSRPAFVSLMAANNETGILQPWAEALALCREFEVPFFCDATQWIGKLPAARLGESDFASGSAHKFGGPRGVGFLKCPEGRIEPLHRGGPQEEGRRAGTENVPGALATMAALEVRERQMKSLDPLDRKLGSSLAGSPDFLELPKIASRLGWRKNFEQRCAETLPGSAILGAEAPRLWNTVSALMPPADCLQRWVVKMDKLGFAVSTGSACASGREESSHVLRAMGYSAAEAARVLRFSGGWETTEADWETLREALTLVHHAAGRAGGAILSC
jgi:cysteine desulfurase